MHPVAFALALILSLTAPLSPSQAQPSVKTVNTSTPWFCHEFECAAYTVVDRSADYETRQYSTANWVSVNIQNFTYRAALSEGFAPLFEYISGANKDGVTINMTAPVLVKVASGAGPFCQSNFTVSFYVTTAQGDTPVPTDPSLYINRLPSAIYFVSFFEGYADDDTVPAQASALTAKLTANGEAFDGSVFWTAGYDAPYKLSGRHNEIWIQKSASGEAAAAKSVAG